MAGWKMVPDEQVDPPTDGCGNVNKKVEVNEIWVDVEACKVKSLFDRIVHLVLEEIGSGSGFIRPLLPKLGDGTCVDLFRVFVSVRERGGFKTVTECCLWNLIAESCGLGCGVGASLKLIYVKYLDVLERWLNRFSESRRLNEYLGKCGDETGKLLSELEEDLECLQKIFVDEKKKNSKGSILNFLMNGDNEALLINKKKTTKNADEDVGIVDCMLCTSEVMDVESGGSENPVNSSLNLECNSGSEVPGIQADSDSSKANIAKESDDEVNNMNGSDNDIMIQSGANNEGSTSLKKRKRESLSDMLNWLIKTAKRPCDPATGCLPERFKWKSYGKDVLWKQVLSAREELFFKQKFDSKADQEFWLVTLKLIKHLQKRQMTPSMYEGRMPERPRSGRNPANGNKSQLPGGVGDLLQTKDDSDDRPLPRIGKKYQADLPEWDSAASESDSKWLGTKIWPLEKSEKRSFYERIPIGRGRQDDCGCAEPGSVECVRFHISEKSARLKPELGSSFHYWRLDVMGENAACNWTAEEETKFQIIVKEYHQTRELWDKLRRAFPARSRATLVSYYFNVYLLRHRAKQNRHTPHHIDSDIEESEDSEPKANPTRKVEDTETSHSSIYYSPKKQKKSTR